MNVQIENDKIRSTVITKISGITQLIAPAGSGKTSTIVSRIVEIFKKDKNACIAAFAFNNFAAEELNIRTRIELTKNSIHFNETNLFIGTIHQFCFELLTSFFPHQSDFTILDEMSRFSLISRKSNYNHLELFKLPKLKLPYYLKTRQNTRRVDTITTFLYTSDLVREESIPIDLLDSAPQFKNSYLIFLELLYDQRYYDFSGLLYDAVQILKKNDGNLNKVLEKYKYFIVDEYQDINSIQEELINLLSRSGNLLVVGDEDQTIYQFRGSNINNFLDFDKRHCSSVNFLKINYRSSNQVIKLSNSIIKNNKSRSQKEIHASPQNEILSEKGDLIFKVLEDDLLELEFLSGDIKRKIGLDFKDNKGNHCSLTYRDIAILVRTNNSVKKISKFLKDQGIPIKSTSPGLLLESFEIRFIIDCLVLLLDLIPGFGSYIEDHPLVRMYLDMFEMDDFEENHFTDEYYKQKYSESFGIYDENEFLDNLKELKERIKEKKTFNLQNLYHDLLQVLGSKSIEFDYETATKLSKFSIVITAFENTNPLLNKKDIFSFIEFLWGYVMSNVDVGEKERERVDNDCVLISTIHRIKGLEFPVVYIPHLINGVFPSINRSTTSYLNPDVFDLSHRDGSIEDERRLFYVALTRSSKYLILSYSKKFNNRKTKPSYFLGEIDLSLFSQSDENKRPRNNYPPSNIYKPLILDQGKIRYYINCPYQYFLRFVLGFSPGVPITYGFGSQIHKLINIIHKAYPDTVPDKKSISSIVDENFFLRFATADLYDTLKEAARGILVNYISTFGSFFSNYTQTEFPFEVFLNGAIIKGSIDMICRHNNKVSIIDFKTDQEQEDEKYTDQLKIYTIACKAFYKIDVEQALILNLRNGQLFPINVEEEELNKSWAQYEEIVEEIKKEQFPASPKIKCKECDMVKICSKSRN
mgnify:CR=1 FL=1